MIGDLFVYNVIRASLLAIMIVCGKIISSSNKKGNIILFSLIVIIAFSLIEGLRWDRGPDYYNNYLLLTTNDLGVTKSEPLFNAIINTLKGVAIPYWACFIFFSFLYIFSFTKVVKLFPKAAAWTLPIMFLTTVNAHENLVRQFIAISFVLFAYNCYIKKKHIATLLLLICATLTHFSGIFVVILLYAIILIKPEKIIKRPIFLVAIYLILFFLWDISYLTPITNYLTKINLGIDSMQGYLDNADRWFTDEGSLSYLHGKSGAASLAKLFFTLVTNCTIIYWGFKAIEYDKRLRIPYWFTFVALIIFVIGSDIEIYNRFAWWLYYFMPIVLGAIWYLVPMSKKIKMVLMSIIIFSYAYAFIMSFTTIPYSGFAFVWDR